MNNEKKIEIPFGAFDSELIRQEINIPNGFNAVIEGDKIILTRIESEDEKVRKALIEMVRDRTGDELWEDYNVHKEEVLAWLEKQGEQKPIMNVPPREVILSIWDLGNEWKELTNGCISTEYGTQLDYIQKHWRESEYYLREKQGKQKPPIEMKTPEESLGIDSDTYNEIVDECIYGEQKIKPKFKVGDWVVNKGHSYLIADIDYEQRRYLFEIGGYTHEQLNWEYIENVDNKYHLWTIQDAKDGDVLTNDYEGGICIALLKNVLSISEIEMYCHLINDDLFIPKTGYSNAIWHPSTKEQREQLEKAMADAGYEWNAEKKELKKIDARENLTLDGDLMEADCMIVEQKSWSEEDEKNLRRTEYAVMKFFGGDCSLVGWLRKSLKDRYTWKPSDEQLEVLKNAIHIKPFENPSDNPLWGLYEQLKKLIGE